MPCRKQNQPTVTPWQIINDTLAVADSKNRLNVVCVVDNKEPWFYIVLTEVLSHNLLYIFFIVFALRYIQKSHNVTASLLHGLHTECGDPEDGILWPVFLYSIGKLKYQLRFSNSPKANKSHFIAAFVHKEHLCEFLKNLISANEPSISLEWNIIR